ncbi:hypothetical protein OAK70_04620 [Akkermansiaceae bacterium]|nr:hypothetical protein [Akkermansiaceae bacterium]
MNLTDTLKFLFDFTISNSDSITWIYSGIFFVAALVLLGVVWGKAWNKSWSLFGSMGIAIFVFVLCLIGTYGIFNLRAASRVDQWLTNQRSFLAKTIPDSGRYNRSVLESAWVKLAAIGGQQGLNPPDQGGNEIRLNNANEALTLAEAASEEVSSILRTKPPFIYGAPLILQDDENASAEAVELIGFSKLNYPVIITAANEWSSTVATLQANHAIDAAQTELNESIDQAKRVSNIQWIASILIMVIIIPAAALNDIKINPKPNR